MHRARKFGRNTAYAVAIVPALMLPACGDKEAPIDPGHRAKLAKLAKERAVSEREKAGRQLAEARQ